VVRALIATLATGVTLVLAACGGYGGGGGMSSTATGDAVLAGHWTGRLHQQGLEPFTVTAVIASPAGSAGNRVHYTGINCSGRWTFLSSSGSSHRFREVIDRGKGGQCKGVGVVTLTTGSSTDRLGYEFRGGGVVSRGTLQRLN
jgi:hypothetical protein